jgi:DNA-binding transcriptional MerR regulator
MLDPGSNRELPAIPAKRYFTIGEVSELCDVKPHVLRYWETEFPSLKPVKRRGNRRYYQRHDVLMVRQIRGLLYEQGYTIGGARLRLEGEGAKQESALSSQIVKQVRMELGRSAAAVAPLIATAGDPKYPRRSYNHCSVGA